MRYPTPTHREAVILSITIGHRRPRVEIHDDLESRTDAGVGRSTVDKTLRRLVRFGLLRYEMSESIPGPGGYRERVYEATTAGKAARNRFLSTIQIVRP